MSSIEEKKSAFRTTVVSKPRPRDVVPTENSEFNLCRVNYAGHAL